MHATAGLVQALEQDEIKVWARVSHFYAFYFVLWVKGHWRQHWSCILRSVGRVWALEGEGGTVYWCYRAWEASNMSWMVGRTGRVSVGTEGRVGGLGLLTRLG